MPTKLLQGSYGINKSLLVQINATPDSVKSGVRYLDSNGNLQTGTLSLSGNAGTGDVKSGKTFYSNNWTKQTGSLSLNGTAGIAEVLSGYSFYSNTWNLNWGTLKPSNMIISTLSNIGLLYESNTPNDTMNFGGRSCRRNSGTRAIWCTCNNNEYYAWACFSLTSEGCSLTATSSYGESFSGSLSTSLGFVYWQSMKHRIGKEVAQQMSLVINGVSKVMPIDLSLRASSTAIDYHACALMAYLLSN